VFDKDVIAVDATVYQPSDGYQPNDG
jgi:hypothetical protein